VSPQPQRDTTAGRTYNDLRNLARRQGQPTDELFQLYLLERFLFRLAHSPLDRLFVLKGGTLLAAYQLRRPTQDIDMQVQQLPGDVDTDRFGCWVVLGWRVKRSGLAGHIVGVGDRDGCRGDAGRGSCLGVGVC